MATLLALFGPKRGVRLELEKVLTVGRSSTTDIQLLDEKVSREHARFVAEGPTVRVEDLGSHNGVYVNGSKIDKPTTLQAGDEIAVGDSLFVLDGSVDVAAARFGEATLVVSPPAEGEEPGAKAFPAVASPAPASHLAALSGLARRLALSDDAESAARAVLAAVDDAFKPDRAFVLLWNAARKHVTPLVGKSDGASVAISRTVLELAASGRLAIVLDDAVEDRALKEAKSVVRHKLRSVAVAPVLRGGDVVGFLHVDRNARGAFTPMDAALLETFAGIVAMHGLFGVLPAGDGADGRVTPDSPTGGAVAIPAGDSPSFHEALRIAGSAARVTSTVLITGESGTGKEIVARFLHGSSGRAGKPFVAVNCGAIAVNLAESELFGHEKGAFTGATATRLGQVEAADGGTLFLDEVGELDPSVQVKLLRVLQERAFYRVGSTIPRRVDVRVIAATHRDLDADVKSGRFREDLFYRLNVIRIHLAPLRERREDVPPLARTLLRRIATGLGRKDPGLSDDGMKTLASHGWPGNARELGNVLERMLVLRALDASGPFTRPEVAAALSSSGGPAAGDGGLSSAGGSLAEKVASLERAEVEAALKRARGVKTRAAEALGISRPTLDKKIADLGIDLWREEDSDSKSGGTSGKTSKG